MGSRQWTGHREQLLVISGQIDLREMAEVCFFKRYNSVMQILAEIHRSQGIKLNGKIIHREAVRAVVLRVQDLLMVYSSNIGDYKFPGGGVDMGETHQQALAREVQEECGISLLQVGNEIGRVIEYDLPVEQDYDVFKMTSYYYACEAQGGFGLQKLDGYELDLGFVPVWVNLDHAIQVNQSLLDLPDPPKWLRREIFVLEYLKQNVAKR